MKCSVRSVGGYLWPLSSHIPCSVGDRDPVERGAETLRGADRSCPVILGREGTLLPATDRYGRACRLFQLPPIQEQLSLLGMDYSGSVSGDQDSLVETLQCPRGALRDWVG